MPTQPTTTLKLDAETKARLHRLGEQRRRSAHWLMLEAITQYLDQEEQRERLREAALQSWQHFQATGLHATGEEVDRWLRKLESGQSAAPPKLHG